MSFRLDILKAGLVKILNDDAAVSAELSSRIYQNRPPPPADPDSDVPTSVTIVLAAWPSDDRSISAVLPMTQSVIRFIVDGTDIWSVNRAGSAIRYLFHAREHEVTVPTIGTLKILMGEVVSVDDADSGEFGYFQQVLEISFDWRTTPA